MNQENTNDIVEVLNAMNKAIEEENHMMELFLKDAISYELWFETISE